MINAYVSHDSSTTQQCIEKFEKNYYRYFYDNKIKLGYGDSQTIDWLCCFKHTAAIPKLFPILFLYYCQANASPFIK